MLISHRIITSLLQIDPPVSDRSQQLTLKSCEIEGIQTRQIPAQVVIGLVTQITKHPNADKLYICQVDAGTAGSFQVCTAASNVRTDAFVALAIPGCHLPHIDLTIQSRKMRGEESQGMICSKQEL